jgi:hypothetical protein
MEHLTLNVARKTIIDYDFVYVYFEGSADDLRDDKRKHLA